MRDIQQVLGHASVATTEQYYAQFSPNHSAKKILRVLQGSRSGLATKRLQTEAEPESVEKGSARSDVESTV